MFKKKKKYLFLKDVEFTKDAKDTVESIRAFGAIRNCIENKCCDDFIVIGIPKGIEYEIKEV